MRGRFATRPRPALFRALGRQDPPRIVRIGDRCYRREEVFKHDSWAATALYISCEAGAPHCVVCKFHRVAPVCGVPMHWFGVWMAQHERRLLKRLADLPVVPRLLPTVTAEDGTPIPHAIAREYIPGRPLDRDVPLRPDFFTQLRHALAEMHRRGIAYVDLHKRENIIVGWNGQPYLVDFQISWDHRRPGSEPALSGCQSWSWRLAERVFSALCQADFYHLEKHIRRVQGSREPRIPPPKWIRWHRTVAVPFRELRRRLLILCGIRSGRGAAATEQFVEVAFRSSDTVRSAAA